MSDPTRPELFGKVIGCRKESGAFDIDEIWSGKTVGCVGRIGTLPERRNELKSSIAN